MNSSYKKYLNLLIIIVLLGYIALQKIEHSKSQVEILKRELHQKVLVNHELSEQISILNNCNKRIYAKLENFINDPISKFEADSTIVSNRSQEKEYTLKNRIKIKKISYKINDNKEKIAIIAAHGTLSNWNMFGLSNTASSMAIRQFAEEIAQIYQKNVDLLVLNWGGELQQKKRIKVGEEVAIFLRDKYKNAEIWGIAHSHGCNIINNTAEKLRDYNLTIKRAILIAPIAVDINPYPLPYNIEEYFNFKSVASEKSFFIVFKISVSCSKTAILIVR